MEVESPFRIIHRTSWLASLSTPVVTLALAPALAGLVGFVSTVTREDILHFQGMYGIPSHIRISTPNLGDRVTSSLNDGIALYKGFLHVGIQPFHP